MKVRALLFSIKINLVRSLRGKMFALHAGESGSIPDESSLWPNGLRQLSSKEQICVRLTVEPNEV